MKIKALPVVAWSLMAWPAWSATVRPSEAEMAGEVERTRAVAADYTKHIPDFICTQTIRRAYHLTLPKNWIPTDVLTVKLRYAGQTEDRQLLERNGQPVPSGESAGGLENIGEFGGMLESVFARASHAEFHWEGWKTAGERAVSVYSYRVEREHSAYMLSVDPGGYMHRLVVGYHGSIDVDRETGGVLRLTYEADGVPKNFPLQSAVTTVEYGFVEVAGQRYLLPVRSEIETDSDGYRSRNISEFSDYRKFSADSTVRFGDTVANQ